MHMRMFGVDTTVPQERGPNCDVGPASERVFVAIPE